MAITPDVGRARVFGVLRRVCGAGVVAVGDVRGEFADGLLGGDRIQIMRGILE
jgi:hypothetical protein